MVWNWVLSWFRTKMKSKSETNNSIEWKKEKEGEVGCGEWAGWRKVLKYKVVSVRISNQQQSNTTTRDTIFYVYEEIFTWNTTILHSKANNNCVKVNDGKGWMCLLKRYYLTLKSYKAYRKWRENIRICYVWSVCSLLIAETLNTVGVLIIIIIMRLMARMEMVMVLVGVIILFESEN